MENVGRATHSHKIGLEKPLTVKGAVYVERKSLFNV